MSNPFETNDFEAELGQKAGTPMPADFGKSQNNDSFAEIDPSNFMKSSLGDHQAIIAGIQDAQKRAEASKDYMSESKLSFIKFINQKKISAVQLDEEIAKLSAPVDGEDFLKNLERVLKENSSRTKIADALKAVAIMRSKIVEGNELKRTLKKASVLKVRRFADELDKQPHEPATKPPTAEEQATEMIHFASQEMRKIGERFKLLVSELAVVKDKLNSTQKAQLSIIEYVKKIDMVVSAQIMPEVYRRHKSSHQTRDYTKFWAKWNDRETKLQSQFAQKFSCENVPAVFGQMLIDAAEYDCSTEINRDSDYIEHRKMWDSFLTEQEKYYQAWTEEYTKIKTESDYSYVQKQVLELEAKLKRVSSERDIANSTVVDKVRTIETLEQQLRDQIETYKSTRTNLDTEKATAEQLVEENRRLNGLNTSQATLIRNLTEERDNLKKSLEKDKLDFASQLAEIKRSYDSTIADLQKKVLFAQKEVESYTEMNVETNQAKKAQAEQIQKLEANIRTGEAQIELMKGTMAELEADLKKSRDEHGKLKSLYEVQCQAYDRLKLKYGGD